MQRGYKILIISGILFTTSITLFFIWGISFSNLFINNNPTLSANQISIFPGDSYISKVFVSSTNKLLTLAIESRNNDQVLLSQKIIGPNESIITNSTFKKSFFYVIKPKLIGEYKTIIKNLDAKSNVNVNIFFGNLPFLNENGEIDLGLFTGFIVGIVLFIGGIVSLTIGIVLFLKDRNKWKFSKNIPR